MFVCTLAVSTTKAQLSSTPDVSLVDHKADEKLISHYQSVRMKKFMHLYVNDKI